MTPSLPLKIQQTKCFPYLQSALWEFQIPSLQKADGGAESEMPKLNMIFQLEGQLKGVGNQQIIFVLDISKSHFRLMVKHVS